MPRTRAVEVSLWEAVPPEEVLRLPEELARVDALLDDPVFFRRGHAVLRSPVGLAVHAEGGLPAVDLSQVSTPATAQLPAPRQEARRLSPSDPQQPHHQLASSALTFSPGTRAYHDRI
jgi:IS5 family transposase